MSGLQPTASNTHLLLTCPRPFAESTEITRAPPGDAANYGSGLHEGVALSLTSEDPPDVDFIAAKWNIAADKVAALDAHIRQVVMAIRAWLSGQNDWGVEFRVAGVEQHLATRLRRTAGTIAVKTRETAFDEESHTYELASLEFGGTYDILAIAIANGKPLIAVLDIKTGVDDWHGGSFAEPSSIDQLRTLAVMTGANIVGVIHAPPGEEPVVYAEEIAAADLQAHARKLRSALGRIESGFMRPVESACRFCPAKVGCPARDAELLSRASALVRSTVTEMQPPVDLGHFHMLAQDMKRVTSRAWEEMKARVKAGEIHYRPDGALLTIKTKTVRNLSMASIKRALGDIKGEKLISRLEKQGCIETREQEELHAVKDD